MNSISLKPSWIVNQMPAIDYYSLIASGILWPKDEHSSTDSESIRRLKVSVIAMICLPILATLDFSWQALRLVGHVIA